MGAGLLLFVLAECCFIDRRYHVHSHAPVIFGLRGCTSEESFLTVKKHRANDWQGSSVFLHCNCYSLMDGLFEF
uniref:Secreted protein n=1 Tax=Setaria viridis TaxID=4556 RepID=A0A4U6U7D8_SETVI|nr:hypothetical protein SEVIR_6G165050v2 [Setaria viridis]